MKIIDVTVQNYKGISRTRIDLQDKYPGNIIPLVGLNECGKTTILEALSHFYTEDRETRSFVDTVQKSSSRQDMIPKKDRGSFSDKVIISANFLAEDDDVAALAKEALDKHQLQFDVATFKRNFSVQRVFNFKESNFNGMENLWTARFRLKGKGGKVFKPYPADGTTREVWLSLIETLRKRMPKFVYFPTFLFDFPERVYLEDDYGSKANAYFRQVLQDVLDSLDGDLSLDKHIVDRVARKRDANKTSDSFLSDFLMGDEKIQIDAVVQRLSNAISNEVFNSWGEILEQKTLHSRLQLDWFIDTSKGNSPYIQASIIDGQSKYSLSERSMGFRWFFCFLLFTSFRSNRRAGGSTIFLLDEPAANLHPKAQMKLIDTFCNIARNNTLIIYSTHSHFMINPLWLEKAYIITNKAVDPEQDVTEDKKPRATNIRSTRYRTFVSQSPQKVSYYQPILDSLKFSISPLEQSSKAIIVEGKFDYPVFRYFLEALNFNSANVYPCTGAGNMETLISIFKGWNVNYRIILDDDAAGRKERDRYMDRLLLTSSQVKTIGDIDSALAGKACEGIFKGDVIDAIRKKTGLVRLGKQDYFLFFSEILQTKSKMHFPETVETFRPIGEWLDNEFK